MTKVLTIIGAGKGISLGVAERFYKEGFQVALVSRNIEKLKNLQDHLLQKNIEAHIFSADAGKSEEIKRVLQEIEESLGATQILHYNAAVVKKVNILEEDPEQINSDFKVNVTGLLTASKIVIDKMKKDQGAILTTGGGLSLQPWPDYGSLAIGKAGLRNLTFSLHSALRKKGIFVATVTVKGLVSDNDPIYNPMAISEKFWELYSKRKAMEIVY
ncbi:SDR family NAD(P)-dependent oxidoreductase [Xanthovirga aplysinae]|uniref:SDR family NAD(P)-dependent oxidoreductase n=1 Tax=Xanthovirga aplysinae TaxID=2529853 RepID=UPI0012BB7D44|nr:SDR family NAD(P)-dependent oxidoreductase [Xanthovirga aplysinae]MTI32701.1 SDR family NAD(P)-dependent oxidoreductase [Xanthovirga aplysinae]